MGCEIPQSLRQIMTEKKLCRAVNEEKGMMMTWWSICQRWKDLVRECVVCKNVSQFLSKLKWFSQTIWLSIGNLCKLWYVADRLCGWMPNANQSLYPWSIGILTSELQLHVANCCDFQVIRECAVGRSQKPLSPLFSHLQQLWHCLHYRIQ